MTHVGRLFILCQALYEGCHRFFCRRSNPNLTEWMERMGIPDTTGLHAYYANRILNITSNINVESIVWQDVRDENVTVGFLVGKL